MTERERDELRSFKEEVKAGFDRVGEGLNGLREEVHINIAKNDERFTAFRQLCDERHGLRPGRLSRLEGAVNRGRGILWTVKTVAPWAITITAVIVSVVLHYT